MISFVSNVIIWNLLETFCSLFLLMSCYSIFREETRKGLMGVYSYKRRHAAKVKHISILLPSELLSSSETQVLPPVLENFHRAISPAPDWLPLGLRGWVAIGRYLLLLRSLFLCYSWCESSTKVSLSLYSYKSFKLSYGIIQRYNISMSRTSVWGQLSWNLFSLLLPKHFFFHVILQDSLNGTGPDGMAGGRLF